MDIKDLLKKRSTKIWLGGLLGMFIGSTFGIAGFGGAIAGTSPFGVLGAYIAYNMTKPDKAKD